MFTSRPWPKHITLKLNPVSLTLLIYIDITQYNAVKKSAYQLLKILKDEIVHTTDIGVQLRIPLGELKKLKAETMKNKRPLKECFTEMLDTWMKGASDRTWGQVFEALEDKNNKLKEDMQKIHKENEKGISLHVYAYTVYMYIIIIII